MLPFWLCVVEYRGGQELDIVALDRNVFNLKRLESGKEARKIQGLETFSEELVVIDDCKTSKVVTKVPC